VSRMGLRPDFQLSKESAPWLISHTYHRIPNNHPVFGVSSL
jgi:hypothetical protein